MASRLFKRSIPLKPTLNLPRSLSLPSDADPNDVVSSAASILTNYRSKSRWATLLSHYPQGFTPLQVSLVLLRIRSNPNLASSFFRFTSENALTRHDLRSFSTIIHIVARARKRSRAHALILTAIRSCDPDSDHRDTPGLFRALTQTYRSCDSTPLVFDVLILAYLELNRIDSCLRMVRLLKSGGFKLDLKTCNALVSRVAKQSGVGSGFDLYRELFGVLDDYDDGSGRGRVRPNAATFNGLLMVCYREGLRDKAEEIWMEMRRSKCDPNPTSYHILMAAYCEEGEVEKADGLWKEMKSMGLRRDIVAYNTLIGGWCKIGKVEIAEELYREMKMVGGIEGTVVTYQHLINGHCKVGDVISAYLLFKEICTKGLIPDVVIVDLLVGELCKVGMVSEGLEVFRYVMKEANFGARRSSYEFLIKGLCGNGEMEEALKLQAEMVGKGFEPDYDVYAAFVDGYSKLGEIDMAEKLREEMNQKLLLKGD